MPSQFPIVGALQFWRLVDDWGTDNCSSDSVAFLIWGAFPAGISPRVSHDFTSDSSESEPGLPGGGRGGNPSVHVPDLATPMLPLISQAGYYMHSQGGGRSSKPRQQRRAEGPGGSQKRESKRKKENGGGRGRATTPGGEGEARGGSTTASATGTVEGKGGRGDPESLTRPWYRTNLRTRVPH